MQQRRWQSARGNTCQIGIISRLSSYYDFLTNSPRHPAERYKPKEITEMKRKTKREYKKCIVCAERYVDHNAHIWSYEHKQVVKSINEKEKLQ